MAHIHSVFDSSEHFVIDPVSREITNSLAKKIVVMQNDHNSERFTFEIPKVDSHNMANCDRVEIHYINIDAADKSLKSTGVYEVEDIQPSPDDNSVACFSWLLSRNCTKYAGTLSFLIHFACTTDGVEDYAWNTAIFQSITIGNGMNNGAEVVEPFPDILAQWKAQLFSASETAVLNVTTAEANALAAIEAAGEAKKQAVLDSIPDEYETLQTGVDTLFNSVASGIGGNASGAVVRVDDVSPVEHTPIVNVHGKNMIPLPYYHGNNITQQGVEITVDEDGVITFNGTALADSAYRLINKGEIVVNGKYTLSGCNGGSNETYYLQPFIDGSGTITVMNGSRTYEWNGVLTSLAFFFKAGTVFNNTQFKPQLEKGSFATEYTPYIDPSTVKVRRCGKNFWHSRDLSYPRTVSGVTINYDPVLQIYTFNGTSTSPGDIYTVPNGADIMHINAGETWTLKVEVMGGTVDGVQNCSGKMSPLVNTADYTNTIHANTEALYVTKTYPEAADIKKMYFYVYASGIVFNNFRCRIQFELNSEPTTFEKFKDMSEYIPAADGTVSGMTSLSPYMTILTDTDGAIVECEYNIDTKTYIDNKIAEMMKGLME